MKKILFITGTDTGVGKTVFTALLAVFLRQRGMRVAALKPVCSGGRDDARKLQAALGGELTLDEINPWHFRAPLAPLLAAKKERKRLKLAQVLGHIRATGENFDVVLVEGAGGLLSPLGVDFDSRDLLIALNATPVIVAPNKLGVINHILLTINALPNRMRAGASIVLMTPSEPDSATSSNERLLKELSVHRVYRLPWLGMNFSVDGALKAQPLRQTLKAVAG